MENTMNEAMVQITGTTVDTTVATVTTVTTVAPKKYNEVPADHPTSLNNKLVCDALPSNAGSILKAKNANAFHQAAKGKGSLSLNSLNLLAEHLGYSIIIQAIKKDEINDEFKDAVTLSNASFITEVSRLGEAERLEKEAAKAAKKAEKEAKEAAKKAKKAEKEAKEADAVTSTTNVTEAASPEINIQALIAE